MLMSFTRDHMDSAGAAEARERVTKWIEQTRQLFSVLPELLVTDTHVNERVSAAEKEAERLRRELEDLKRENHQLRGERDEIAQAMTVVAQRLGFTPRKSPFERTHAGDHTDRKSTRLNSSHSQISYAVFCLKKKQEHVLPH